MRHPQFTLPLNFKSSLALLISAQLVFSPLASVSWAKDESQEVQLLQEQLDLVQTSEKIAQGQDVPLTDPFHLLGQYVEIYDGGKDGSPTATYRLDSPSVALPTLAYTSLKAYYDPTKKLLVIEAQRGANEKGEHGQLVARQYIPNVEVAALAQDSEILSLIDTKGRLHAIDWGYVAQQVFHSPVPVFADLNKTNSTTDLSNAKVTATYLTSGVVPFRAEDVDANTVIPMNENGEPVLTAGDLLVQADNKVIGVFSRKTTHQRIQEGSEVLQMEAELLKKDDESIKQVAEDYKRQEQFSKDFENDLAKLETSTTDPLIAMALQSLGDNQIQSLRSRASDHERYKNRENDWFTLKEWNERFTQIQTNAAKTYPELAPASLARGWKQYVGENPKPIVNDEENIHKLPKSFYVRMASIVAGVTVVMASPAVIEHFDLQQIAIINYFYSHMPDVLKDASYRWPLLANTLALMGIWPGGIGVSMLAGKALGWLNKISQSSNSAFAQKIRDLAGNWAGLKNFQRITSFGMRFYAEVTLSMAVQLVERAGRQKTFFTALKNGLNPFKRVRPDSEEGQKAGITSPTFLGLNNPFVSNGKLTADMMTKIKMQSDLKGKKQRLKAHAWLLAAIAVAEQYDIDLSTLLEMEGKTPTLDDLKGLLENPKARGEWELLTVQLQKHIMELPYDSANGELKQIDTELLKKQYEIARQAAQKLNKMSGAKKYLKQLRLKAKKYGLQKVYNVLNLGREQYSFLKNIYANDFVSSQVEREFVGDHLLCVYLIALVGERADLLHPENLAAANNPWTLWSTRAHLTDMGNNTYAHFFSTGSQTALLYQQVKPQEEMAYQPYEDVTVQSPDKEQGFLKGLARWIPDTLNPFKADLAGQLRFSLTRKLQTIQAFFIMNVGMRMLLGGQSFHDAFMGSSIFWLAAFWYIGWMWLPSQAGNNYHGKFFAEVNSRITAARRHILWAFRQSDPEKAKEYLEQGANEMKALYDEHKPKALKGADLTGDLESQAKALLELSKVTPPLERKPNSFLTFLPGFIAAFTTTYAAIPLMVATYTPSYLNMHSVAEWLLITPALIHAIDWAYSKKAWSIYLPKLKKLFGADCEDALTPDTDSVANAQATP